MKAGMRQGRDHPSWWFQPDWLPDERGAKARVACGLWRTTRMVGPPALSGALVGGELSQSVEG